MGKTRRQANRSSASAIRGHKRFDEARNSLLGPENASRYEQVDDWTVEESTEESLLGPGNSSRYEHTDDWTVEESTEQESEDDTDEDKRLLTRARVMERRMADPVNRGATGSCDRTLQDILRGSSGRPRKKTRA